MSPTPSELLSTTFAELMPAPLIPMTPDVFDLTPAPALEPLAVDSILHHRRRAPISPG
jgi:hypothetical protein